MSNTNLDSFFSTIGSLSVSSFSFIISFLFVGFLIWFIPWLIKQAIIEAINETNSTFDSNSKKLDRIVDLLDTIKSNLENSYISELNWWDSKKTTFATRILDELKNISKAINGK